MYRNRNREWVDESVIREHMAYKSVFGLLENSSSEESAEIYRRIRAGSDIFTLHKYVQEALLVMKVQEGSP